MTDADPDHDDELVSAYLDGAATAAERARVEGDPRLQARLAELRAVAEAVGRPVPSVGADAAIARALAAVGPVAPVVSLDAERRRRQRLMVVVGSAAAAVVVAILALPALLQDDGSGDQTAAEIATDDLDRTSDDTSASAADAGDDAGTESEQADDEGLDGPDATTPLSTVAPTASGSVPEVAEPAPPDALGSFATRAEAQLAVSAAIDAAIDDAALRRATGELTYRSLPAGACDAAVRAGDDELVGLVFAGDVAIAGVSHQVLVYELVQTGAQNGTHRVYELTLPDCVVVSEETI
jgi:hypothetical protein